MGEMGRTRPAECAGGARVWRGPPEPSKRQLRATRAADAGFGENPEFRLRRRGSATKTPPSHGRIAEFFALFRVHEPRRQSQCHGDSIRRRWHYFEFSTPATIQMGPRRPPEHRHHQPPPPPLRIAPMAPLRVPGTGRRSQAAPSHLNTNLGPLSYHTPSRSTEIPSGGRKYTEIGL